MPLKKGGSDKVVSENIRELLTKKPSKTRSKAIRTIAKKSDISYKKARQKQAIAIALQSREK